MAANVTVIGSINMDLVTSAERMPEQGETILGEDFATIPGGKGSNQAVAAARLGGNVHFIGRVGDDAFSKALMENMKSQGIHIDNLKPVTHLPTGIATIVLAESDNRIIVVPGANAAVTRNVIEENEDVIASSDVLLLQLEIPLKSVERAAELAKKHGTKVILNPAPYQKLPESLLENVDLLTPNEHEYELLVRSGGEPFQNRCIVTKGAAGVELPMNETNRQVKGYAVDVVDTTGAGDTSNGALAVALGDEYSLNEACVYANAAAALSVGKMGAQAGMPTVEEVENFLASRHEGGKRS